MFLVWWESGFEHPMPRAASTLLESVVIDR